MNRSCITQRGLVLLLVVSTSCPALYAGFKPEQHVIVQSETHEPTSVYAADLDGDGDLDVLSASCVWSSSVGYFDSKIAWYANDGSGGFGPKQVIAGGGAYCVYAADLDGDGDLDVLSAFFSDEKIAWYANDGTGQFGGQQVITTEADWANCLYAADLDGDGDLDVLSASVFHNPETHDYTESRIAWYANDGSGHFGPQQIITTAANGACCAYAADLDVDGDLDVLSASSGDDKTAWYENDGSGHFGPQQVIATQVNAKSVYAADLDGDGDVDVLATSSSPSGWDGKITWYANDGLGRFGAQQVITTGTYCAGCVYAADLDGDGDLDVLSASSAYYGSGKIARYANEGSGHFGPEQAISTAAGEAWSVYAADLDGDGDLDVLCAFSYGDDKIVWYANDGTGQFGSERVISPYAGTAHAADLDGDGDLDVLCAFSYGDDKIAWYANDGSGHFGPRQVISTEAGEGSYVCVADLDGDGDPDVLLAWSYPDGKIAWYANDGSGHFGPQQVVVAEAWVVSSLSAADLDGDGDLDILVASPGWDAAEIAWYANDGAGGFGPEQVIAGYGADCMYAADLDGDGDLDVLAEAAWYANDGSGHFGPEQVITTVAPGTRCVYAADLDGDGDLDVLSASCVWTNIGYYDSKIAWYANDGSGGFGPQQVITTAADGACFVSAADLDGDGDLDVLSGSHAYSGELKTAWYANDGSGQFGPQQVMTHSGQWGVCGGPGWRWGPGRALWRRIDCLV